MVGLMMLGLVSAQQEWIEYTNSRFGYSLRLPVGLAVSNRAADGSGLTWQTGTVRVQVSGTNNPYKIAPQQYFSGIKGAAGDRIVAEEHGKTAQGVHWYEILFTRESRRVHRKVFVADGSINSLEYSYGYRFREDKEALARRVLQSFKPGDLRSAW
ncbi:MAG: hypothetical protein WC423_27220 [Vulcanimicrobiota bacterium]